MKLLKKFGSIERIAKCDEAALTQVVGKSAAREIIQHFAKQRSLASSDDCPN
jgi:ERCC4-type nuclease